MRGGGFDSVVVEQVSSRNLRGGVGREGLTDFKWERGGELWMGSFISPAVKKSRTNRAIYEMNQNLKNRMKSRNVQET